MTKKIILFAISSCVLFTSCKSKTIQDSSNTSSYLENPNGYEKVQINDNINNLYLASNALPATNNRYNTSPKILVVPVDFSDAPAYEKGYTVDKIKEAFIGNDENDRSVKNFYYQSSYGKCDLEIDIYPTWYRAKKEASVYELYQGSNMDAVPAVTSIISDFIKDNDQSIDFSEYDSNKDGYIDSIYFIYSHDVDYIGDQDLWWAFKYQYMGETLMADGVSPYSYVWAGYQFMYENSQECNINTYIHELGHLFGLDDYYDYDMNRGESNGGLGGKDLMDHTVGDHNPFSKMLLGWANNPTIITTKSELTIDLKAFQREGDFLILTNNWDINKGMFQEYFILEYYTPDNVQEFDKIFKIPGIRVIHVNAEAGKYNNYLYFKNDNSYSDKKLISLVAFYNGSKLLNGALATDANLFTVGETLLTAKYNDGTKLNYSFTVDELSEDYATLTIKHS